MHRVTFSPNTAPSETIRATQTIVLSPEPGMALVDGSLTLALSM